MFRTLDNGVILKYFWLGALGLPVLRCVTLLLLTCMDKAQNNSNFVPISLGIIVRFCIPKFGKKIRHAGARSKMHTKIRSVCSEKAHFAENIFRMHFLVEEGYYSASA